MTARSRRTLQANDISFMTKTEVQKARFEADAECILGEVLYRRHWSAKDRDAIASAIEAIVQRERRLDGVRA